MQTVNRKSLQFPLASCLALLMGMASSVVLAAETVVTLSGDQEVPSVTTNASGTARFTMTEDMSLSGSVKTDGIKATAAHIHTGASGENGPVAIPLTKQGDNEWIVPADTKLTAAQVADFEAGRWYVNVHSAAHTDGEIRGQLK